MQKKSNEKIHRSLRSLCNEFYCNKNQSQNSNAICFEVQKGFFVKISLRKKGTYYNSVCELLMMQNTRSQGLLGRNAEIRIRTWTCHHEWKMSQLGINVINFAKRAVVFSFIWLYNPKVEKLISFEIKMENHLLFWKQ